MNKNITLQAIARLLAIYNCDTNVLVNLKR